MHSSPSARDHAQCYDVVVLGLERSPSEVVEGLQRVFGLDAPSAQAVIAALPATVCHRVNEIRAQYFMRALCAIGARVELRSELDGALRSELDEALRPTQMPPPAPAPANDVALPPLAARVNTPSTRAATMLMGSDPSLDYRALQPEVMQHEATVPRSALPELPVPVSPAASGAPRWGELLRDPPRLQPISQPRVSVELGPRPDPSAYGERALPTTLDDLPLASLSPANPVRERVQAMPAPLAPALHRPARPVAPMAAAVPKAAPQPALVALDASFWSELPGLLTFPWRERGLHWFIAIGIWAVGANVLSALAQLVPFVGTTFVLMVNASVLALSADYHRRCMWAVANAEGPLAEGPDFEPARILHTYMRSGLHLLAFVVVSQLPLVAWLVHALREDGVKAGLELVLSRRFWLLSCLPGLYWPMAVATASLHNRFGGIWYVPVGVRALVRAPLEYATIALIGTATFLLPWLLCTLLGRAAGLPSMFFVAATGLPLAASHAVMGTLTGQLMRARPQLFESAAD